MNEVIFDSNNTAETSKNAYKKLEESGEKTSQKQEVRKALEAMGGEATIGELAHEALAGWQKSTISGRLNDLKDEGVVQDLPENKRKDKYSGITVKPWRLMVVE